jgi:nucleotide-binding universal stress UspA family protein
MTTPERLAPATTRPILVGVDGSDTSTLALEWAAVRALAGHTSLHIVHVIRIRTWLDPYGLVPLWDMESRQVAERLLNEAALRARRRAPQLQITTRLRGPDPAAALLDEGRRAELIVLGRRHWPPRTGWLSPSVTTRVARRARGRVVIVGPDDETLV